MAEIVDARPKIRDEAGLGVTVHLSLPDRMALEAVAKMRGVSPDEWLASLAGAHLSRMPRPDPDLADAIRDLAGAGRQLAGLAPECTPPHRAESILRMLERIVAAVEVVETAEAAYWGLEEPETAWRRAATEKLPA